MRVFLPYEISGTPESEILRKSLGVADSAGLYFCHSIAHALTDITRGLYSLFPHKMHLIYQKDGGPYFESLAPYFSREGCKMLPATSADLGDVAWLTSTVDKKALVSVVMDEDPLTAETYSWESLYATAEAAKSAVVRVSTLLTPLLKNPLLVRPYEALILELEEHRTILITGEKLKFERVLIESGMGGGAELDLFGLWKNGREDKARVLKFESEVQARLGDQIQLPVHARGLRVFDRAVVSFEGFDGSALRDLLIEKMGPEIEDLVETSSLCRWSSPRGFPWLEAKGLTESQIRGLVVFDHTICDTQLLQNLKDVLVELKRLQGT